MGDKPRASEKEHGEDEGREDIKTRSNYRRSMERITRPCSRILGSENVSQEWTKEF